MLAAETSLLFPFLLIFALHECEEIFTFRRWMQRNGTDLSRRFPFSRRFVRHTGNLSTAGFALIAAEEFFLLVGATWIASQWDISVIWVCLFLAFVLHLVVHIVQCLIIGRYIPGIVSTLLAVPFCIFVIIRITDIYAIGTIVSYTLVGSFFAGINLVLLHKWVAKYTAARIDRPNPDQ